MHTHTVYSIYTVANIWETVIQKEKQQRQTENSAFLASCSRPKKGRGQKEKRREAREEEK